MAVHVKIDLLNEFIKNLTNKLQPFGATNFQLKLTNKGPVVFEINPRFSGATPIRAAFGLNEIYIILSKIYNKKIKKNKLKYGAIIRYCDDFFIRNKDLIK